MSKMQRHLTSSHERVPFCNLYNKLITEKLPRSWLTLYCNLNTRCVNESPRLVVVEAACRLHLLIFKTRTHTHLKQIMPVFPSFANWTAHRPTPPETAVVIMFFWWPLPSRLTPRSWVRAWWAERPAQGMPATSAAKTYCGLATIKLSLAIANSASLPPLYHQ